MSVIVSDNFVDADGTLLGAHIPTLGAAWTISGINTIAPAFNLLTNRLQLASQFSTLMGYIITNTLPAKQFVQVGYVSRSTNSDTSFSLLGRASGLNATFTAYALQVWPVTNFLRILGYVNGLLVYNSGFAAIPAGLTTFKLLLDGNTLTAYGDGVAYINGVNGAIPGAGSVGLGFSAALGLANTFTVDDFVGDDTISNISYSASFASGRAMRRRRSTFNPSTDIM